MAIRRDWTLQRECELHDIVPGRALAVRVIGDGMTITVTAAHVYGRDNAEWQDVLDAVAGFHEAYKSDCHLFMSDSNVILEKCDRQVRSDGSYTGVPALRARKWRERFAEWTMFDSPLTHYSRKHDALTRIDRFLCNLPLPSASIRP
eukprot:3122680-Amphidinium_carterae.1